MQDVPARRGAAGALSATHRAGAEAATELIARSASAHTRRVYASALGQLAAWLAGRRLDDASLAAYLGYLHQAGRAPATAALAVAAVRRAARDAGEEPPAGPLTRQALEGFRRSVAADAPARRGQARGLTAEECAAVLATCGRPRRTCRRVHRPRRCHPCRSARRRLEGRQHGGPLRRLGRHPRQRRQPLHAMKDRRAVDGSQRFAVAAAFRVNRPSPVQALAVVHKPAEDPPAGSDRQFLTPELGSSAPVSRRRYYSGGDVRSAEASGEGAGLTARGRRIRSGG